MRDPAVGDASVNADKIADGNAALQWRSVRGRWIIRVADLSLDLNRSSTVTVSIASAATAAPLPLSTCTRSGSCDRRRSGVCCIAMRWNGRGHDGHPDRRQYGRGSDDFDRYLLQIRRRCGASTVAMFHRRTWPGHSLWWRCKIEQCERFVTNGHRVPPVQREEREQSKKVEHDCRKGNDAPLPPGERSAPCILIFHLHQTTERLTCSIPVHDVSACRRVWPPARAACRLARMPPNTHPPTA